MTRRKLIASVAAALLALAGAVGTAAKSLSTSSSLEGRVQELEKDQAVTDSRYVEIQRRLEEHGKDLKELLRRVK